MRQLFRRRHNTGHIVHRRPSYCARQQRRGYIHRHASKQLITGVQNNEKKTINIISENSQKIKVEGTGFSANGKDFSFIFTGEVSGEIVTEE